MFITRTVTKKILETLVHETFSQFGSVSSSSLLDSLKLLGFYYATNAGISINIEDLKTPNVKREFIKTANDEIVYISKQWEQGFVSDTERFQTIIDSWNVATESLKDRIVEYYQNFDPANNLYIMAFSGARGNMSQVRQLVGMRGLMSDQEGKIIDLPIQANFREGLTSIDYIISSYGARKGIVDTALKTADSGYLTRRLIYIAQDLVIREKDCQTKDGVIILLNKSTNIKNIIGRTLLSIHSIRRNKKEYFLSLVSNCFSCLLFM
jgi:DNA-directed RNA polymerase subunit beta'